MSGLKNNNRLRQLYFLGVGAVLLLASLASFQSVQAAPGINESINFQGRLLTDEGATVPDGFYNIQFKIYQGGDGQTVGTTGSPAGTAAWTESHLNDNGDGVTVKNGFLSVQLGSVTAFGSAVDWNQDTLWLSMNIGSTNGSCSPFSSCSPDGQMLPMKRLSATPYSLNSALLGGVSSAGFVQLAQGLQTDSSAAASIQINDTGGGNLISLQSGGDDVFTLDNAGDLTFGNNQDHTISVDTAPATTSGNSLTISGGDAGASGTPLSGGDLVLQGGAGSGGGATGNVIVKANGSNSTGTLQVKNAADDTVLGVDTVNSIVNVTELDASGDVTVDGGATIAGNVGIGTTNPSAKLDVRTDGAGIVVQSGTISTDSELKDSPVISLRGKYDSDPSGGVSTGTRTVSLRNSILTGGASPTYRFDVLDNTDTELLSILGSGEVGIGITNPGAMLDVDGDAHIQGGLSLDDSTSTANSLLVLDSGNADPTGQNGSMYYSTSTDTFRCYEDSAWKDCVNENLWQESGSDIYYTAGNIGLGTSSPSSLLTIANDNWISAVDSGGSSSVNLFKLNTSNEIDVGATLNVDGGVLFPEDGGQLTFSQLPVSASAGSGSKHSYTFKVDTDSLLTVYGEADGSGGIQNTGVGVGTITPRDKLEVLGDIRVGTGTTGCVKDADGSVISGTCSSDARLKTNIRNFKPVLADYLQLDAVTYNWRASQFPERGYGNATEYGLIAQNVEAVFPELVTRDKDGYRQVNFSALNIYTTRAVQELGTQAQRIKQRVSAVEADITDLQQLSATTQSWMNNANQRYLRSGASATLSGLNVSGTARLNKLIVSSDTTINGTLSVRSVEVNERFVLNSAHLESTGEEVEVEPLAALGEANELTDLEPVATADGTDVAGTISFTAGETTTSGAIVKLSFDNDYQTQPRISLTPKTNRSALLPVFAKLTPDGSGFTVHSSLALKPGHSYSFDYIVIGSRADQSEDN